MPRTNQTNKAFSLFPGSVLDVTVCYLVSINLILLKFAPVKRWASLKIRSLHRLCELSVWAKKKKKKALFESEIYLAFKKTGVLKLFQVQFVFSNTILLRVLFLTLFWSHAYGFGGRGKTYKPFLFSLSVTLEMVFGTAKLEMSAWLGARQEKKVRGVLQHLLNLLANIISVEKNY